MYIHCTFTLELLFTTNRPPEITFDQGKLNIELNFGVNTDINITKLNNIASICNFTNNKIYAMIGST